jgi:CheY-like chemotaxis protein
VLTTDDPGWRLEVLVVDGHSAEAAALAQSLRLGGHRVRVTGTGAAALAAAAEAAPDVVLLDPRLPDRDGWEVASQLRAGPAGKHPFVVAMVGRAEEQYYRRSEESGVYLHLVKPVDAAELAGVLARFARVLAPSDAVPGS